MEGILTGVAVGTIMIIINAVAGAIAYARRASKAEEKRADENAQRIAELEARTDETKELVKLTLSTCIIIGDGMVQSGINGDVKKAFCQKKQDALKML